MKNGLRSSIFVLIIIILSSGCTQPAPNTRPWMLNTATQVPEVLGQTNLLPTLRPENSAYFTPTPDSAHAIPELRSDVIQYIVQSGDTLASIAINYNLDTNTLASANGLSSLDWLQVGQSLTIPAPKPTISPSNFKTIPDSELVYGPVSSTLDIEGFIRSQGGFLSNYTEVVSDTTWTGAQIVTTLAKEYSVNPRILLAVLEYRSGWVTQSQPSELALTYPIGLIDANRQGLYRQLSWAANQLNRGFYLWGVNALSSIQLNDGNFVTFPATLNAGTVSVQRLFALLCDGAAWANAVSENGLYATYTRFFGIPFDLTVEPLLPANLSQPSMQLPFEGNDIWSFTGGPHGAWGDGAAWAAIDFAPPGEAFGCYSTNTWEVAVADGIIARSENGEVVLDLDGDGLEQTGWTVLFMHVASNDRIALGTRVRAGDRIGHPSCEGGVSNGTHLHLARRYNGVWISADGNIPFILDNWVSSGSGIEYDGTLARGGQIVTAWDGRIAENQIQR
ncbi:MAG: LysM peptidoglycan-binding domain-containing protein [Anaerolineaceae bacterium]